MARVVHFEIHAAEPERAARFYESVFDWRFRQVPAMDYWTISTGEGPGIDGGMLRRRGEAPLKGQAVNAHMCTIGVDDLDASMNAALAAGATLALPRMAIPMSDMSPTSSTPKAISSASTRLTRARKAESMMRIVAGLCLCFLAACGRPEARYRPEVEINFMNACLAQGSTQERCACIWGKIESNIDPNSFAALEQLPGPEREAHPLMQQIRQYQSECPSAPAGGVEPPPAP